MKSNSLKHILLYALLFCFCLFAINMIITYNKTKEILTENRYGWTNNNGLNSIAQEFLSDCKKKPQSVVLEIGAGNGSISAEAIKNGAFVWMNELDIRNLKDFSKKIPVEARHQYKIIPGDFPSSVSVPLAYFDSVSSFRVLHFFSPQKLQKAIATIYAALKHGGKVYIVVATPNLKEMQSFIPEYKRRKKNGDLFPGYIEDVSLYTTQLKDIVPQTLHLLDATVLRREFERAGFNVLHCDFIQQKNFLTQRQDKDFNSIGLIAWKGSD